MPTLKLRTRVFARDSLGRFLSELEAAKHNTLEQTAQFGERVARAHAPKKTGRMAATISGTVRGAQAHLEVSGPVALWQELGTHEHPITGSPLSFWWEREGVHFIGPRVRHPGNPARHFMAQGFSAMSSSTMDFARRYYPR